MIILLMFSAVSTCSRMRLSYNWQLVQTVLKSIQQETISPLKKGNLSRLRGIAKGVNISSDENISGDYVT